MSKRRNREWLSIESLNEAALSAADHHSNEVLEQNSQQAHMLGDKEIKSYTRQKRQIDQDREGVNDDKYASRYRSISDHLFSRLSMIHDMLYHYNQAPFVSFVANRLGEPQDWVEVQIDNYKIHLPTAAYIQFYKNQEHC
jgi:hypothetical protein